VSYHLHETPLLVPRLLLPYHLHVMMVLLLLLLLVLQLFVARCYCSAAACQHRLRQHQVPPSQGLLLACLAFPASAWAAAAPAPCAWIPAA
jgi:hypothetical protein